MIILISYLLLNFTWYLFLYNHILNFINDVHEMHYVLHVHDVLDSFLKIDMDHDNS